MSLNGRERVLSLLAKRGFPGQALTATGPLLAVSGYPGSLGREGESQTWDDKDATWLGHLLWQDPCGRSCLMLGYLSVKQGVLGPLGKKRAHPGQCLLEGLLQIPPSGDARLLLFDPGEERAYLSCLCC